MSSTAMCPSRDDRPSCCEASPLSYAAVDDAPFLTALVHDNRAHGWPTSALRAPLVSSREPPKQGDDPSIALLEAWAAIADVLAFYEERIANESFLRTASTYRSVGELARLVGYELRPGIGVTAEVAFVLEAGAGEADRVEVPRGALVRCAAVKSEPPATLVTAEPLDVRAAWNALRPLGDDPLEGNGIAVDGSVAGLPAGRPLLVQGVDVVTGTHAAEVAIVEATTEHSGVTTITLSTDLYHVYRAETAMIHGNVVRATHADVTVEVLGSGDASSPQQAFRLSASPVGASLEVRVDGVPWRRIESFRGAGPEDRVFVADAEGGDTVIRFGDGVHGRSPPGEAIFTARYRTGAGSAGNVGKDTLSQLTTRPTGIAGVTNPVAASGGSDAEVLQDTRANAPASFRARDRLVSLRDHEDFARAFPGVAKATASNLWDGSSPVVHVTVAASDETPLTDASLANIRDAIRAAAGPARNVVVQSYAALPFAVRATLRVDESQPPADPRAEVIAALAEAYSFARVDFGEVVEVEDVADVLQQVRWVTGVEGVALQGPEEPSLAWLAPRPASVVAGRSVPAQLPVFDPTAVEISLSR